MFFKVGIYNKSNVNPLDLDPKELCVTDTSLFVIPSLTPPTSSFYYFFQVILSLCLYVTQKHLHTSLLSHFPNDHSDSESWVLWWKWAQDIYIFGANPLLMCLRLLIGLFYLWVWHVGFIGVNYSSVLERQLSPLRTHSTGRYVICGWPCGNSNLHMQYSTTITIQTIYVFFCSLKYIIHAVCVHSYTQRNKYHWQFLTVFYYPLTDKKNCISFVICGLLNLSL